MKIRLGRKKNGIYIYIYIFLRFDVLTVLFTAMAIVCIDIFVIRRDKNKSSENVFSTLKPNMLFYIRPFISLSIRPNIHTDIRNTAGYLEIYSVSVPI